MTNYITVTVLKIEAHLAIYSIVLKWSQGTGYAPRGPFCGCDLRIVDENAEQFPPLSGTPP